MGNVSVIKATSESDTATLFLATPYTANSAYKCAIIAQGLTNYSKSKLNFVLAVLMIMHIQHKMLLYRIQKFISIIMVM